MNFQSVTPSRIEANFKIWDFELTAEDMVVFDKMNVGWRHLLWAECSMHPDYPFKVFIVLYQLDSTKNQYNFAYCVQKQKGVSKTKNMNVSDEK